MNASQTIIPQLVDTGTQRFLTYEEAVEQAGFGKFQIKLMIICGLGWAADAMEVLLISFALPAITEEWNLTIAQRSLLSIAIFMGMLLGAWTWGRLSDLIGRKVGFISTIGIDSLFGLLSAFAPTFGWLVALRAMTGFGVGGTLPVDYSIFAEYMPKEKRGRYLVLLESFWALGVLAAAGLAWLIVPRFGWRMLLAVSAIPGIIIFFIRKSIPESPRYLMIKNQPQKAYEILTMVAQVNGRSLVSLPIQPFDAKSQSRVRDLVKPGLLRTTLLLWIIWFMISLGYYGVFTWLPSFLKSGGMALMPVYQNTFILALAQLPGYFSAAYLVEKWGRRRTLAFYLFASGIFTYFFAVATSLSLIVGMGIWMSFFTLGAWGALYAYTPEAYPTNLRGTGMGAASGMTRIAGALSPGIVAALPGGALVVPLSLFALSFVIGGGAALALPHETVQMPLSDM